MPALQSIPADYRATSHLSCETVDMHPWGQIGHQQTTLKSLPDAGYRILKMRSAKTRDAETNKGIKDKDNVIYNDRTTIWNIPLETDDYIVNGKLALEWGMERLSINTDKNSGTTKDANLWATETITNPKYPLELLLCVITVSLKPEKIVDMLPKLEN